MMVLAWLCEDERVRHVAARWSSLTGAEKQKVEIERLCQEVGMEARDFIREAAGTAWELGIEFPLRFRIEDVWSYVQQVEYDLASGPTLGPVPISLRLSRGVHRKATRRVSRGERVHSMEGYSACDNFAAVRQKWGLSQAQFASLLMTSIRTVRRWEDRLFSPTPDQQWLIERFVEYVRKNGRRAFLRRFVRQAPRFQRPGRPSKRKSSRAKRQAGRPHADFGNRTGRPAGGLQP